MTSLPEDVAPVPTETSFYLSKEGEVYGPHTVVEIRALVEAGVLAREEFVWIEASKEWLPLEQFFIPLIAGDFPLAEEALILEGEAFLPGPEEGPMMPEWDCDPEAFVARGRPDHLSRRLGVAGITALFLHLGLLAGAIWAAPVLFKVELTPSPVPPVEAPPLEVAFVPEEAPPPPPPPAPVPDPPEETPPPEPPPLPPPPAPVDLPMPVAAPNPLPMPALRPEMDAPPPAPIPPPRPVKIVKRAKALEQPVAAPAVPQVTDAGPSDYLYAPLPSYPYEARRMRQQGTVILLVRIDDAGDPEQVSISQSSGSSLLDESARKQVAESYRFKVGNAHLLRVPISFQLAQ